MLDFGNNVWKIRGLVWYFSWHFKYSAIYTSCTLSTLIYFIYLLFPGKNGGVPNGPHVSIVLQ